MNEILNLENPVFRFIRKAMESAYLNILWLITSLPIVTCGAATTALFYVLFKMINDEEGNITKQFFAAFRSNFRQSTKAWLIMLAAGLVLALDGYVTYHLQPDSIFWTMISSFLIVAAVLWIFVMLYLFPLMSRFENSLLQTFKNSMVLSIRFLLCSVMMAAIHIAMAAAVIFWFTPLIVFGFGTASMLCCYLLRNIFTMMRSGQMPEPAMFRKQK